MHDCALGRDGKPSAPRVEHRYYVGDRIMVKTGGVGKNFKIKSVLYFVFRIEEKSKNLWQTDYSLWYFWLKIRKKKGTICEISSIRGYMYLNSYSCVVYIRTQGESDNE